MASSTVKVSIVALLLASIGCGPADKAVRIRGLAPHSDDCALLVSKDRYTYSSRSVRGEFVHSYVVSSADSWLNVEVHCDDTTVYTKRFSQLGQLRNVDVGDLSRSSEHAD